jgi:tetratricopeptide (TPR) repeat protein
MKFAFDNKSIFGLVVLASLFFHCCSKEQPRTTVRPLPISIELDSAIEQGEAAQRLHPDDVQILIKLGKAYADRLQSESYSGLSLAEDCPRAYGRIIYFRKLTEKAIRVLERGIEANPNDTDTYVTLAKIYIDQREIYYSSFWLLDYLDFRNWDPAGFGELIYSGAQRSKHLESAYDALQKALSINRRLPDALLALSYVYTEWGNYDSAIAVLKNAVAGNPRNAAAWYHLGRNYHYIGNEPEAISSYRKAFEGESNGPFLWLALADPRLYHQPLDFERFNRLTKIVPPPAKVFYFLGLRLLLKEEITPADRMRYIIRPLERAVALRPDFLPAYETLLPEYVALKDYEKALRVLVQMTNFGRLEKHYTPEISYGSYDAEVYSYRQDAKFISYVEERLADSVLIYFHRQNYSRVLELEPNNWDAHNRIFEHWSSGVSAQWNIPIFARRSWMEVLDSMKVAFYKMMEITESGTPHNLDWGYCSCVDLCSKLKDKEDIIELFKRTWRRQGMYQPLVLGATYSALEGIDRNSLIELFRSSMVKDSVLNSLLYMYIGRAYDEGKEYERAVPAYEKSIALNWENYESHEALGKICEELQNYTKAIDVYNRSRNLDGRREQRMLAHVAEVYEKLGQRLKSDSLLAFILEQNPKYAFAHYVKGRVFLARGLNELALNSLRRAAELGSREAEREMRNVRADGPR